MLILILCIVCNVLLAVIFKAFAKYEVDNLNAIIVNYLLSIAIASILTGHFIIPNDLLSQPWIFLSFLMAILFIVGFNLMALSFQKAGVALTVVIVKMSLILPVLFAITLYDEALPIIKALGILSAIAAIILVNMPTKEGNQKKKKISLQLLLLPIIVWLLSGLIEVILYYVQAERLVTDDSLTFVATSFGMAGILGIIYSIYRGITQNIFPKKKDIIGGLSLGLPNFLTIYLLLYLLGDGWEGSVLFPINNIGILLLTSLLGVVLYKEKIDLLKGVGLALSLLAILLLL